MSSRLFQEIRERRGLCYTIFAQAGAYSDTGMLTIYAGTGAEQIAGLVEITVDELKRSADDLTAAEVERARAQMKAGLLMGLESPSNRAERMARMLQIWGRILPLAEVVEHIEAVTLAGCADARRRDRCAGPRGDGALRSRRGRPDPLKRCRTGARRDARCRAGRSGSKPSG